MEIDYVKKNKGGERKRMFVKARIVKEGGGGGLERGSENKERTSTIHSIGTDLTASTASRAIWCLVAAAVCRCKVSNQYSIG